MSPKGEVSYGRKSEEPTDFWGNSLRLFVAFSEGGAGKSLGEARAFLYQRGYIPELEAFFHSVRTGAPISRDLQMAKSVFLLKEAVIRSFLRGTVSLAPSSRQTLLRKKAASPGLPSRGSSGPSSWL